MTARLAGPGLHKNRLNLAPRGPIIGREEKMAGIGACGDDCAYCPRYAATQSGSAEELEKVKELWARLGLRDPDFPADDMACFGCKAQNSCAYSELRACACGKGIDNCGLCDGYPCGLIGSAWVKSERLHSHARNVCTLEEMDTLRKAFFSKRQNLDRIHLEVRRRE